MNNTFKRMSMVMAMVMVLVVSCRDSFLEVAPTGSLADAQLATKAGVEGVLIGAYAALNGVFGNRLEGPNHWVTGSICGGEANKGTDPGDYSSINPMQRYETDPTQGDLSSLLAARARTRFVNSLALVKEPASISASAAIKRTSAKRMTV